MLMRKKTLTFNLMKKEKLNKMMKMMTKKTFSLNLTSKKTMKMTKRQRSWPKSSGTWTANVAL